MVLNKDFREFIELLNQNDVKYLIVGGYAVAVHGYPRYTKDIDIWIFTDESNLKKIVKAINDFGFKSSNIKVADLKESGTVVQLGLPPNRIDLITDVDGVDFDDCYNNKFEIISNGLKMNFIGLEHLKKNKKASGRYQDLADLENLE
ncbi:MAG: hypothetical protein KGZ85_16280 [Ignavibacterium sp.]|jgi:hypothetical protein|nr:hypothetical protein [Ignavibacterium sp.]